MITNPRRWDAVTLARLVVGLLLLTAVIMLVEVPTILSTAMHANLFWIGAAMAILPVNLALEVIKWRLLLSGASHPATTRDAAGSILAGYTLGLLTPARVGEYAGRALYLSDPKKGVILYLAALDRMYSFWVYAFVGTVVLGCHLDGSLPGPRGIWLLTFTLGLALVVVIGVLLGSRDSGRTMIRSLLRGGWARQWQDHFEEGRTIRPSARTAALLLSIGRYAVFSTQFVLLVLAFAPESPILGLYFGITLVFFAKTVIPSITLFDLGVRESAAIFFLGVFGVLTSAALNASLLLFAINVVLPALVGIALVPGLKWTGLGSALRRAQAMKARTG